MTKLVTDKTLVFKILNSSTQVLQLVGKSRNYCSTYPINIDKSRYNLLDSTVPILIRKTSFNDLDTRRLSKQYVVTYIRSVLPLRMPDLTHFNSLMADREIVNYFKRIYPFSKLVTIEHFLKRSKFYDAKFMRGIEKQVADTRSSFFRQLEKAKALFSIDYKVNISSDIHIQAMEDVYDMFHGGSTSNFRPDIESVMAQVNMSASSGLPRPWQKKSALKSEMRSILMAILSSKFDLYECVASNSDAVPYTAAFLRNQITNSSLKTRIVFAVGYVFLIVETYFNCIAKIHLSYVSSGAIHGKTQLEISKIMSSTAEAHTLCVDYKSFDQKVPLFVAVSMFLLDIQVYGLTPYLVRLYRQSFIFFMFMPVFHPSYTMSPKLRGLNSGSGYTSMYGSRCNMYMLCSGIRIYMKKCNIDRKIGSEFGVYVSGDDTVIHSNFYINFDMLSKIMSHCFDVDIEKEFQSMPNVDHVFFLGSEWINGEPVRNINRMFGRILFGSSNFPEMTPYELFSSRCFEILGNTCQYSEIYETFNVPWPNRVFRFLELADYNQQLIIRSQLGLDRRGIFTDVVLTRYNANLIWTTR